MEYIYAYERIYTFTLYIRTLLRDIYVTDAFKVDEMIDIII